MLVAWGRFKVVELAEHPAERRESPQTHHRWQMNDPSESGKLRLHQQAPPEEARPERGRSGKAALG